MNPFLRIAAASSVLGLSSAHGFQFFEGDGFDTWVEEGTAFGKGPVAGPVPGMNGEFKGYAGDSFVTSGHGGDASVGSLTSPDFKIEKPYIHFLVAGGNLPGKAEVELLIDGKVVLQATGANSLVFRKVSWDVRKFSGKTAKIKIVDQETGRWGVIGADHFLFSDSENFELPAAAQTGAAAGLVATPVIAGNNIPEGTSLAIFADHEHQQVTSPTALTFDEAGNLYVAETHRFRFGVMDDRDHTYWYFDDIASKTTADRRALHEKWKDKVSIQSLTAKSEVIRRFTDPNNDGKADLMTVFADGFNDVLDGTAGGVFSYLGKTYFACIPKIHVLEDQNGDGVADKRGIVADGFGVHISLSGHDMNGFALGMDGRIYGTIGDRGFSVTTREGRKYDYPNNGAVFRFEPDGSNFEVIHTGLRNPKEIAFDELGNGITVDNNSDQGDPSRIVYIMDGVDSGWRIQHQALHTFLDTIGLAEKPISPWMTEKMANLRNPEQPAFIVPPVGNLTNGPSGLTYHPGAGFLDREKGRFLICDYKASPAASQIWSFKVGEDGAGMKYQGAYKFNSGVTATDVEYGFDGRLYVADFMGGWEAHPDGRVYTLTADQEKNSGLTPDTAKLMKEGFAKKTNAELALLFLNPDQRIRQRAHLTLAARKDGSATLISATKQANLLVRLHGVWGLGIRARKDDDATAKSTLISLVADKDPEVRAQAAQILGEVPGISPAILLPLLHDPSLRVRAFAALSLGRMKTPDAFQPALALLVENADKDLYLRHAAIMAMLGAADVSQIAALQTNPSESVRIAAVVALRRLKSPEIGRFLTDASPAVADEAIRAIHDERINAARPAVAALLNGYTGAKKGRELKPMICRRIIHTAFRLGGAENAKRLVTAAASPGLELSQRMEILRLLAQWPKPSQVDQSIGLWDPLPDRAVSEVSAAIEAGLPALLADDAALLAPTLQMVEKLHLSKNSLPADALLRIATTATVTPQARTAALDLWIDGNPSTAVAVLVSLAADPADDVAKSALQLLAKRDPEKAVQGVAAALKATGNGRRQAAWSIAANLPGDTAAQFIIEGLKKLTAPNPDRGDQIELLEAAKARPEPAVKTALAAYESSLDPKDPLAAWQGALDGGDAARGEKLFYTQGSAQCMRCHTIGEAGHGNGGDAGPNLAGVGARHERAYFLESMIVPGAKVAPGFGIISLTLKTGGSIGGVLDAETADHYDLTAGKDSWRVRKSDVSAATQPVSTMPPMASLISIKEARDLVAFLDSLKTPLKTTRKPAEPKPYDPSKAAK